MISYRVWPVIKREVKVKWGKGFVLSTIFIPLLMGAVVGVQALLANMKSDTKADITLVMEPKSTFEGPLRESVSQIDTVKSGLYTVRYAQLPAANFDAYVASRQAELTKDHHKGLFLLPNSVLVDKKVAFYSSNPANAEVRTRFSAALNRAFNLSFFAANNIQNVDTKFLQTDVNIVGNKVSANGSKTEGWGPLLLGGGLALLLLLGVTFNAMPVMNVVVGEKADRVYEILLSSVKPGDLLSGKIIGCTVVAALQMLIWVAAGVALLLSNNYIHGSSVTGIDFKPWVFVYYFVNYVTGLAIFLSLYAGLSSMFDNAGSASSALLPLYFVILLPFYTVFSLVSNPANAVAQILSLLPITSLYVMPARMALIDVPLWQPLVALAGNIAVAVLANLIASKIYRISVLSTGNNPTLRQVLQWAGTA